MNRSTLKQQMEEWFLVAILFALVIGTVIAYVMRRYRGPSWASYAWLGRGPGYLMRLGGFLFLLRPSLLHQFR
jgi:hypothetical protein